MASGAMNRRTIGSFCSRARPGLDPGGHPPRSCFFSTTPGWTTDKEPTPATPAAKSNLRQRTHASAREIGSLVKDQASAAASSQTKSTASQGSDGRPHLIDVKSLPRGGLFRRGGTGGRGEGPRKGLPGDSSTLAGSRFSGPSQGAAIRGRGGIRGRGRAGGRGGGRAGGRKRIDKEEENSDGKPRKEDGHDELDDTWKEFDKEIRFGTRTTFSPSFSLESLSAFMPANVSTAAGRTATVLQNLSILGAADPVGAPQLVQARNQAEDLERTGVRFYADPKAKEETEAYLQQKRGASEKQDEAATDSGPGDGGRERIITDAEESVRRVIIDKALSGQHEKPSFATDALGVTRSWLLRADSYTPQAREMFEKKVKSLVEGKAKASGKARKSSVATP